jgi:hypothetical protein
MAFHVAAGIAPLHQVLLLRYLYGRFVERNGRPPFLGAVPYAVLALFLAKLRH